MDTNTEKMQDEVIKLTQEGQTLEGNVKPLEQLTKGVRAKGMEFAKSAFPPVEK